MPRIPTSGRQVEQQALRTGGFNTRAPVTDFSSTLGALADVASTVGRIEDQERAKVEASELDAFESKLRDEKNRALHDKEVGFLNKKGKTTLENFKGYQENYKKFADEGLKGLGSESLRNKAQRLVSRYNSDVDRSLNNHTSVEMQRHDDSQTQANLNSVTNDAVLNYKDKSIASNSIAKAKEYISGAVDGNGNVLKVGYAQRKGMSKAEEKEMLLDASTRIHSGIIQQALNNNEDLLAKDYFDQAKKRKEINAKAVTQIDGIINAHHIKGESQRQTDTIISEDKSLSDSLADARSIKDPELRDATVRRVRDRWNEKDFIRKDETFRRGNDLKEQIDQFGTMDHVPEAEKMGLTKKKRKLIEEYSSLMSRGVEPKTDPIAKQDLFLMASTPETRDKFLKTDLTDYITRLSRSDYNKFLDMRRDIQQGGSKYNPEFGKFLSDSQTINNTMTEVGISNKKKRAQFTNMVQDRAIEWQRRNQKKDIPQDELKKISDSLATEVTVEGFFFDSNKRLFEVSSKDSIVGVEFDSIPENRKAQIREALEGAGKQPSEEEMIKVYQRWLKKSLSND